MAPLLRTRSQVFVDIPPSPLHHPQAKASSSTAKKTSKSLDAPPKIRHRLSIVEVEIPYSPLRTRSNSAISKVDRPPSLQSGAVGTSQKRKIKTPSGDQNSHVESTSHVERPSKKKRVEVPPISADLIKTQPVPKPVPEVIEPKKRLPPPKVEWVPIPDAGTKEHVENRIMLREFFQRFGHLANFAKTNLKELDSFDDLSDKACKAVLISLLDILASDEPDEEKREINTAIKNIRAKGLNIEVMWESLRALSSHLRFPLAEMDTSSGEARVTRTGTITCVHATQLVPVLISLIAEVVKTADIRDEIDQGNKNNVQLNKDLAAKNKEEMESWALKRKKLAEEKEKAGKKLDISAWNDKYRIELEKHRNRLLRFKVENLIDIQSNLPRFRPLGVDHQGRTYYTLSRPIMKSKVPPQSEREELRHWTWMVFVWGTNPNAPPTEKRGASEEKWWGFARSDGIRNLSKWVLYHVMDEPVARTEPGQKSKVPTTDSPDLNLRLKALSKGLVEFADYLDLRCPAGPESNAPAPALPDVQKEKRAVSGSSSRSSKSKTLV